MLTENQVAALEKAKSKREAHGEIQTHHPGYLGTQDTYFEGTMKGVGHIYQQTFQDSIPLALEKYVPTENNLSGNNSNPLVAL